jgi:hypothetical protein
VVLRNTLGAHADFIYRALTFFGRPSHAVLLSLWRHLCWGPTTPITLGYRFGLFPFRSPLLRESLLFSLPPGTEMFHFPGFAPILGNGTWLPLGFPIRTSPDQSLFPAPRCFSQVIASFFASLCQGIHRMLLASYLLSIQVLLIENTNFWYVSRSLHIALRLPDLIILFVKLITVRN